MFRLHVDDDIQLELFDLPGAEGDFRLVMANRAHIGQFLAWADAYKSLEDAHRWAMNTRREFARDEAIHARIWHKGEQVGAVGLMGKQRGSAEIGYWLAQSATGKGIMTRSVRAIVDYGFRVWGLQRMFLRCATANVKSCAIPERLGFTHEGTLRHDVELRGERVDHHVFSILRDEWDVPETPRYFQHHVDDAISLRPLHVRDTDAFFALVTRNRDHLLPWMAIGNAPNAAAVRSYIEYRRHVDAESASLGMGLWLGDVFAGMVVINNIDPHHRYAEFAYLLDQAHSGQGIMTRTVRHLTRLSFDYLGLNRMEIICSTQNHASRAVAERLGYTLNLVMQQSNWYDGKPMDMCLYGMLRENWQT